MSDNLKKLTGKNPKDFEPAAYSLINNSDVELFSELVKNDDFLFDFVKSNVASRLAKQCNESNYLNLLNFLKFYSPSYEEFIVSILAQYADEDLTDRMLEIFETGSDDEKTYCAKFFSYIQDPLALDLLRENAYSENISLSRNCASTLGIMSDEKSYSQALEKLHSNDGFEQLAAVEFLVAFGRADALEKIIEVMKTSSFAENISGEIPYLVPLAQIYKNSKLDALYVLNSIINGLGEILALSQVFDFGLYEFLEFIFNNDKSSPAALVLANAQDKFFTLTENDEYLFDEDKDTKNEIYEIKDLLSNVKIEPEKIDEQLIPDGLFVFTALDFTNNSTKVRGLLSSNNPALVVKSLEVLKKLGSLEPDDKTLALKNNLNDDIKNVIVAI